MLILWLQSSDLKAETDEVLLAWSYQVNILHKEADSNCWLYDEKIDIIGNIYLIALKSQQQYMIEYIGQS